MMPRIAGGTTPVQISGLWIACPPISSHPSSNKTETSQLVRLYASKAPSIFLALIWSERLLGCKHIWPNRGSQAMQSKTSSKKKSTALQRKSE
jgi:hypothetical protein